MKFLPTLLWPCALVSLAATHDSPTALAPEDQHLDRAIGAHVAFLADDLLEGRGAGTPTSSKLWKENSRKTFLQDDGRLLFCIWLDWDERWVAWNMAR